ncbi:MAG: hypothetical protein WCE44_06865 [Candidatus Velthaea sp.]
MITSPITPASTDRQANPNLARFITVLRRRSRLGIRAFLAIFLLIALAAFVAPRTYTTNSEVLLHRPQPQIQPTTTGFAAFRDLTEDDSRTSTETFVALAERYGVAERVTRDLKLPIDPADLLRYHITVTPLTNTDILQIAVSWSDPDMAARIANAFAGAFIDAQRSLNVQRVDVAVRDAKRAMDIAQRDVVTTNTDLARFESKSGFADVGAQTTALVSRWNDVRSRLGQREAERQDAAARLAVATSALARTPATIPGQATAQGSYARSQLEVALAQSEAQLAAARQQFTDNYPTVAPLKAQVNALRKRLAMLPVQDIARTTIANPEAQHLASDASTLQEQLAGDTASLQQLDQEEKGILTQMRALPGIAGAVSNLAQRAKAAEDALTALRNAYYDALVARTVAPANASIVQTARAADAIAKPNRALTIAVGFIIALIAALALVLALDRIDETVKDEDDLARRDVPYLGTYDVPRALDDLVGLNADVRRTALRLRLALSARTGRHPHAITFSAADGDIASSGAVACALAVNLASSGLRTLLIDADLHGGQLARSFGVADGRGVGDALESGEDPEALLLDTATGVKFLPAGRPVKDEYGALLALAVIVGTLAEQFDTVVIEAGSVDTAAGLVAAGVVDAAVLVATPGSTRVAEFGEAVQALRGAGTAFAGVVLRGARESAPRLFPSWLGLPPRQPTTLLR